MHVASYSGHRAALQALQNGCRADLKVLDQWEKTPLHYAVERGDTRVAQILLEHVADGNAQSAKGLAPWKKIRTCIIAAYGGGEGR